MFRYWYRIYDRYEVDITALAVFTGDKKQLRPDTFHMSFLGTEVKYKYNTYHILDHSQQELLDMNNPFALIVLAAQKALLMGNIPEEELGEQRLTVAQALIRSQKYNHEQIMHFLYFLRNFVSNENPEINRNFDKDVKTLTGKNTTMGIEEFLLERVKKEGILEDREKRNREIAENLLKSGVPIEEVSEITTLSIKEVTKVSKNLKRGKSS